jgi:hypothetical protein
MALVAAGFAAAATCSSQEQTGRDTGAGGHSAAVSGAGGAGIVLIDAGGPQTDPPMTPPGDVVFPDSPFISCDDSASDGGGCDFIPSVCAVPACDDAGACTQPQWLRGYTNPRCIGGRCVWDSAHYRCGDTCVDGGCHYNGTTLP